jgi:hypothetical protein
MLIYYKIEMKKIVVLIGVCCITLGLFAQAPYSSAFGGRIEMNSNNQFLGFTYKHFTGASKSYEIIALSDFSSGLEFYGLYQYNGMIPDFPPKLRWVIGGGANLGSWNNDHIVFGLTGMLGVEYSFDEIPLNLGLDWKPVLDLVTNNHAGRFFPTKFGISIRYTINNGSSGKKHR